MASREELIAFYDTIPVIASGTLVTMKSEAVRAAARSDYVHLDLSDPVKSLTGLVSDEERKLAEPSQWAALLVAQQPYGLQMEQFGTGSDEEAKADRDLMSNILLMNSAVAGAELFQLFGGHIVERARRAGMGVFAVLEIDNVIRSDEIIKFAKLSYPRALTTTPSKRVTPKSKSEFQGVTRVSEANRMVFSAFSQFGISLEPIVRG